MRSSQLSIRDGLITVVGLSARQVRHWRRRWVTGDFSIEDETGRGRKPTFPPLDRARVHAMACQTIAQKKLPLGRQSIADLTKHAKEALGRDISSCTEKNETA